MRLFLISLLSFCFSVQPSLLIAAQSQRQAEFTKDFLRDTRIASGQLTLKEIYETNKNTMNPPTRAMHEELLEANPNFKMPKPTILRSQDAQGKETIQLSYQVDGQSIVLTFLGEPERFVKVNDRVFTMAEASNPNYLLKELQDQLRVPANQKKEIENFQPQPVFLSVSQISALSKENKIRYWQNVFSMMQTLEEFNSKLPGYDGAATKSARSKLDILFELGLIQEAQANQFSRAGAQCMVAGWAGYFATSQNPGDCSGRKAPCTFCQAPPEAKTSANCGPGTVTCNPALYGPDAAKECVPGANQGATTKTCNDRFILNQKFYEDLIARTKKDPAAIEKEISRINSAFSDAHNYCGSLTNQDSYKLNGRPMGAGVKAELHKDQLETCAQLGVRIKDYNANTCTFELMTFNSYGTNMGLSQNKFTAPRACAQQVEPPAPRPPAMCPPTPLFPQPSPAQPTPPCVQPEPTPNPPATANPPPPPAAPVCPEGWSEKSGSGEGISCQVVSCQVNGAAKSGYTCGCNEGYKPYFKEGTQNQVVESCYKDYDSKVWDKDKNKKDRDKDGKSSKGFFSRNKSWLIPLSLVTITLGVGYFALHAYKKSVNKQMCTVWNVCTTINNPVVVTPVTTTTQPASMPAGGTR